MGLRLFLGVFPPEDVLRELDDVLVGLTPMERGLRWTKNDQRHVTLFFLGDSPEDQVDGLKAKVTSVSQSVPSFDATLKGLDGFPDLHHPKTLFVPTEARGGGWLCLYEALRPGLTRLGFKLEVKPYRPHLTLARLKDPKSVQGLLPGLKNALGALEARWTVDSFRLVSSRLDPQGVRYETLETFPLKKEG